MGTCIQQGDLFHSVGLCRNQHRAQLTQEKLRRGFGKNAGEWTRRVEICEEEIPGSKHNIRNTEIMLEGDKNSFDGTIQIINTFGQKLGIF